MQDREKLVAPCGLDCGICELYLSRNNQQLMDFLVQSGIPQEHLPCDGCRSREGQCPVVPGICATFRCAEEKQVNFCHECSDFPCSKLTPAVDRANVLPHNMKVYNLCLIQKEGVEKFIQKSGMIKQAYYQGKMKIGQGPQLGTDE